MNVQALTKAPVELFQKAKVFADKNSPSILTGLAVAGVISTTVMAIKATPKAEKLLLEAKIAKMDYIEYDKIAEHPEILLKDTPLPDLTALETLRIVGMTYGPTVLMGGATIGCILGANSINLKRNAALAASYALTSDTLRDYKAKTKELLGEKKEQKISDAVTGDKIKRTPVSTDKLVRTGRGETLCFEPWSGRYFLSDIEYIRKIINDMNVMLINQSFITMNELYYALDLPETKIGDQIGWEVENGKLVEPLFTSTLTEDNTPCLVLDFQVAPKYGVK